MPAMPGLPDSSGIEPSDGVPLGPSFTAARITMRDKSVPQDFLGPSCAAARQLAGIEGEKLE
jgi:hypothetical protein